MFPVTGTSNGRCADPAPGGNPTLATTPLLLGADGRVDWQALAHARAHCPVFHSARHDVHVVTTYAEARFVLENPALFSSVAPNLEGPLPVRLPPLDLDPPRQQEIRRMLNPFFSRSSFTRLEPEMRAIARSLVDRFVENGRCEFVSDFAIPFNSTVLAQLVFHETDAARLARAVELVSAVAAGLDPQAFGAVYQLVGEYLHHRAKSGERRDDLIGALLAEPLTEEDRIGVVTALFLGGLNTTHGALANIMTHLATRPELEQRLRDPAWVRHDLDEFIRYEPPVLLMCRTATADVELAGAELKAGDRVAVHFASANRDERRFDRAGELWFDRPRASHAGFGLGVHRCVGLHLARLQIEIAFAELLRRCTRFRLAGRVTMASGVVLARETVPVAFDRR